MNMKLSDYAESAKSRVSETLQNVQSKVGDTARAAGETADRYVHENPWRMVAIIALTSCIFGYLMARSRD
jgi:ElaB/YqjD/DUF883 family membrane-anchored ribosome-binding protein